MSDPVAFEEFEGNYKANESLKYGINGLKNKFEQTDWLAAEQSVGEFNKSVFLCLKEYAADKSLSETKKHVVLGEKFYCSIRNILEDYPNFKLVSRKLVKHEPVDVPSSKKEKNNKKKSKCKGEGKALTSDEIRFDNSKIKIVKFTNELLSTFDSSNMTYSFGLDVSKYVEFKGITFMYCAWFILAHLEKYKKRRKLEEVYEVIVAIQKFIRAVSGYIGKSVLNESIIDKVSETLVLDLQDSLDKLLKEFPFDGLTLYEIAPKLLVFTKFDSAIPTIGIKPRKNQVNIISTIKKNVSSGFLLSYKAMVASGKTTTCSVCIPEMINVINQMARASTYSKKYELIACCNLPSVKGQMAQSAYNAGIKFAVAYRKDDSDYIITVNHNTTTDADRSMIICSPDVAAVLLQREEERCLAEECENKYWFFLDEPTTGASNYGSESLIDNMKVLLHMPPRTILSSATMCELGKIPSIINYQKTKYPSIYIGTIYSNEIQIGCNVKTFENDRVLPHLNCKNKESLRIIIKSITENPFLGRLYTTQVAQLLWEKLDKLKKQSVISKIPDIKKMFSDVSNLSLDKVREVCMEMLSIVAETTDPIVTEICQTKITEANDISSDDEEDRDNDDDVTFEWNDSADDLPSNVTLDMLGTYQAHKFLNMNLIADTDPVEISAICFKPLLEKIRCSGIDSAKKLYANYERDKEKFQKSYSRLDERVKCDIKRSQQQQEMQEEKAPMIAFPEIFQVNTLAHIKEFAHKYMDKINPREIRTIYPLELIPFHDCNVPDWIMLLLYAGIGIYSPTSKVLNDVYNKTVLQMASSGSLAFLVADSAICYGTNYPIYREFITQRFGEANTINTLFQLLGRTGRVGQSWSAEAYIDKTIAIELLKYVCDPESESANLEANNMEKMFSELLEEYSREPSSEPVVPIKTTTSSKIEVVLRGITRTEEPISNNIIPLSQVHKKNEEDQSQKWNYVGRNGRGEGGNGAEYKRNNNKSDDSHWRKNKDYPTPSKSNNREDFQSESDFTRKEYSKTNTREKNTPTGTTTTTKTYVPPHKRR